MWWTPIEKGEPTKFNPTYFGQIWSVRTTYGMKIKLGRLFSIDPSIVCLVNDKGFSLDLSTRLYLKDRYYVGGVMHDNGNGFSGIAGATFGRFELGASVGKSLNGTVSNNPVMVNLFLNYKFLRKKPE
jgi:hypothetical protein